MTYMSRKAMEVTEDKRKGPLSGNLAEGKKGRILVVDDDELVREVLAGTLAFMGYDVDLADSGVEGLRLFLTQPFDLVLTDLQMPGIDGFTLAIQMKDESPETPVVLMTGHDRVKVLEMAEGSCVDSVLFKPLRLESIQRTIQGTLGNGELN